MRVIRIHKFVQEDVPINWLIEGLLPDVGWTLFYGQRAVGKTTFAMQLCCALQEGTPFMGRKAIQTDCMYLQADSLTDEWRAMLTRIAPKSNAMTIVDVPAKALGNASYIQRIGDYVDKFKPGFMVWDSLYNLTPWSIATEQVLKPIDIIKDICGMVPWMLIHHPPQNELRPAGHHSLGGNCSNEWALTKTMLKIEKGRLVKDKSLLIDRNEDGLWIEHKGEEKGYRWKGVE